MKYKFATNETSPGSDQYSLCLGTGAENTFTYRFNYPSHYQKDTLRQILEQLASYDNGTMKANAIKQNETL